MLVVWALMLPLNLLTPRSAEAVTIDSMNTAKYTSEVNGDFILVGNGVLVCDPASNSSSFCASLHGGRTATDWNGVPVYVNDYTSMVYTRPAGSTWVNGSSATLTVPAGARVVHAELFWAGNTGRVIRNNSQTATTTGCMTSFGQYSAPNPALAMDTVLIDVNGVTTTVTGSVTQEAAAQIARPGQALYYSSDAVVTDLFTSLPTGTPQTITVGNIYTPQGNNCFGGWALNLVYDFDAYVPGNEFSRRRAIYSFDGHVRQFQGDPIQTISLSGLNPQGTGARAGFVAYEGDRNISGETVTYSDPTTSATQLTNAWGETGNMWGGRAEGSVPYYSGWATGYGGLFVNASVDAYSTSLPGLVTGDTSLTLRLFTNQDSYLMQNAIVSVPIADAAIYKTAGNGDQFQVLLPGETPTFQITIYNSGGGAPLENVVVNDPATPGCSRPAGSIPSIPVGGSHTYTCTGTPTSTGFTNVAQITARSGGVDVENSDATDVEVADIVIEKSARSPDVPYGTPGAWVLTVTNTGSAELRNVVVSDPVYPDCARNFATLVAGATQTWECPTANLTSGTTNTASVTAQAGSPNQTPVTVTSSTATTAAIRVSNVALTKTVSTPIVRPGDTATFTFTIDNTGETPLNTVAVNDPAFPTCSRADVGPLAPGESTSYTCAVTVTGPVTNTATVTGTPPSGTGVTATSSVRVDTRALTIDKLSATTDVNGNTILDAGDTVAYTFAVANTGSVELTDLQLMDPMLTGLRCPVSSLAPGATTTCTAGSYTVTPADVQAGTLRNTATITGTAPNGTTATASDTETLTPVQQPNMTLVKRASPTTVDAVGQLVTYTFTATNTGNVTLANVRLNDPLNGLSGLSCSPALGSSLAPGEVMTCTGTRATTQGDLIAGQVNNTATLSASAPNGSTLNRTATANVTATQRPALTFDKQATPSTFSRPGQAVTYTLVTTNTGNVPLTGVTIRDSRFTSLTCSTPQPATLNPGEALSCTATYTTSQNDVDGGAILNNATTSGTGPGGQVVTGADSEVVTSVADPTIDLAKTPSRTSVTAVGQTITYTFTATNTGNQTLTNVRIADPMARLSTLSCNPAQGSTLAPLGRLTCTATYVTNQDDLDRGYIANTATVTGRSPSGDAITDSATANVTATQSPVINIAKTVVPTAATTAGTSATYTFQVTNNGNVTLNDIGVTDPLVGLSPITCSPVAAGGSLAPGASTTCTATRSITQADVDAGGINNTATASGTVPPGTPVQATSSARITIAATPAITIRKTADPLTAEQIGQQINYGFTVTNTGNVTLSNTTLTDTRVTGLTCTPAMGSSLEPGASMDCTASRAVTQTDLDAGSVLNTATVRSERPGGNPANPADDITASDSATVISAQDAAIDLEKTTTATGYEGVGDTIPYTFTVRNTGNVTLTGVSVTDTVTNLSPITCDRAVPATLAPNEQLICTATKSVSQAGLDDGSVTNSATATGTGPTGVEVSDRSAVTVIGTESPAIEVVKTASPATVTAAGQQVTYTFTATNTGNQTLTNVQVVDPLDGLSPLNCTPALGSTLAPRAVMRCTASRPSSQADVDAGSIINTATATGTAPHTTVTSTEGEVVPITQTPRLAITKTATPARVTTLGQQVTYNFTVTNTGNVTASNVVVTDPLTGLSDLTCTPAAPATLAPGQVQRCTAVRATTQTDLDAGSVRNTATVNATAPDGTAITPVSASTTVNVTQSAAISLDKTVTPATATSETGSVTYGFTITNTGNVTVSNVALSDDLLPAGAVTCTPAPGGSLAPGAAMECSASRTITQNDVDAGTILNNARVSASGANGAPVTPATDSAVVTITQNPDFTLTKTANPATVSAVGQVVTYSFTLVNTGDVTLRSVRVSDPMPGLSAISCPRTALAPDEEMVCTATRSTTQADLNAGTVVNNATATAETPLGDTTDPSDDVVRTSDSTVTATQNPQLTLAKTTNIATVTAVGQQVRYTMTATNSGNVELTGVRITDPHEGLRPLTCTPAAGSTLAPQATMTCTADYIVTQTDLDRGSIPNSAAVTGTSPTGVTVQADASRTVGVTQAPSVDLTKQATPANVSRVGQEVTYSFNVRNTGNTTLREVAVSDELSGLSNLTCDPPGGSELSPGQTMNCTATRATTQDDLDAGSVANTARVTALSPTGAQVTDTSTTTVRATQNPTLSFVKTADRATYSSVDEVVEYTVTATNTGNVTLHSVLASDSMTGLSDWACTPDGPVDLAPGETKTCTASRTITQSDLDAGRLVNDAQVSAQDSLGRALPVQHSSVTITAEQRADLNFTKSASPTTVSAVGQLVTYTFEATNTGNVSLANVFVSDQIPGLSTLDCGAMNGPVPLAPGQTKTCTATRAATQADLNAGSVTNTASVRGEAPGGDPADPTDDVVRSDDAVVAATQSPRLSIDKRTTALSYTTVGQRINYTITVTNTGNVTLTGVGVSDTRLADLTCVPAQGATLAPRAAMQCSGSHVVGQDDLDAGSILNTATTTGHSPAGESVSASDSVTSTAEGAPALDLIKEAAPSQVGAAGELVTYTFALRNTGNLTVENVTVTDELTGLSEITCTPAAPLALAPGETANCTATYRATQADIDAGSIENSATASGTDTLGDPVSDTAATSVSVAKSAGIEVSKTANITSFDAVGTEIVFTKTVTNTGNVTLSDLTITDPLPGLTQLGCGTTTLAPGESTDCTGRYLTTQADLDSGSVANQAHATAVDPDGVVQVAEDSLRIPAVQTIDATFTKSASPQTVNAVGQVVTYTVFTRNDGNVTLGNVSVSDPKPGLTNWTCNRPGPVSLAPGDTMTCTATYTVTQADLNAGEITNTATQTASGPTGVPVAPRTSSALVEVDQTPALQVTKVADRSDYGWADQQINYTIDIANTGNVRLDDVRVDDPLLGDELTCSPAQGSRLEAGARMTCTGSYGVTQADVDNAELVNDVSVTGTPPTGQLPPQTASLTIPATHRPDILMYKAADVDSYSAVGDRINYEFVIINTGNVTLTDVSVVDPMPGLSNPVCPVDTLAPGDETTCTASYLVTQEDLDAGSIGNVAEASATAPDGVRVTDDGATSAVADMQASLHLTKTALTPTVTAADQPTSYRFVITNDGNVSISNVQLTDSLAGMSAFDCEPALGATLAPGEQLTCTADRLTRQSDIDNGGIVNTATVTGDDPDGDALTPVSDSADVVVTQSPAITLTKVPSVTSYDAVDDRITYTVVATNTGNLTLNNVVVTDPMPGLTNWSCDLPEPTSLAPGEAKTCTGVRTITQADLDAGSILNTARVTSQRPDGAAMPTVTAPSVVTAQVNTGLTLTKQPDRTRVAAAGEEITYSFDATNTGTVSVRDVQIEDPAAGLSELSCSPALGGTLAPGATMHCTATKVVTPDEMDMARIDNHAVVTGTGANGDALRAEASATVIPIHQPRLSVTKTADTESFNAVDQPVNYTIRVTNTGNALVNDVTVSDDLPGLSALSCDRDAPVTLDIGESMTCTASYTTTQADLDAGQLVNVATPAGTDPNDDPVTLEPGVSTVPATLNPQLTLEKSSQTTLIAGVGSQVVYFFDVTNTGNVTISDVTLDDQLPGLGDFSCSVAAPVTLAPGESMRCQASYLATQDNFNTGSVTNAATATGNQPNGRPLTGTEQGSDTLTIPTDSRAELVLEKNADKTSVSNIGEVINYTIRVTNTGNETVNQVSPTDAKQGVSISCDRTLPASLQPGGVLNCTAAYTATETDFDAGAVINTASVEGRTLQGAAVPASDSVIVTTDQTPQVSLLKQADRTTVSQVGQTIIYTIVATNTGNVSISDFDLHDTMTGLEFLGCTAPVPGTLAVGQTITCRGSYEVTQTDLDAGSILNSVTVSGDPAGPNPLPPTSSSEIVVAQQNPLIDLVKTANVASVDAVGDPIIYTLEITNTGNTTLTDIIPDDPLTGIEPIGCSQPVPATLAPRAVLTCTGRYLTTHADLEAGSVRNTASVRGTSPQGEVSDIDTAVVTAIYAPAIALDKTVTAPSPWVAGDEIDYTFVVENVGTMTATNIAVSDPMVGLTTPQCEATTLEPGETTTCTASYEATQADVDRGRIDNVATATAQEVTGQPYQPVTDSAATTTTIDGSMTLTKTAEPTSYAAVGDTITYTFVVRNTGLISLSGVSMSDPLSGLSPIDCPTDRSLLPDETLTCTASYQVTQTDLDAGSVMNTALARAVDAHGRPVADASSGQVVPAAQQPSLELVKTPNTTSVSAVGERIGYAFTLRNTGNVTVTDAVVTDAVAGVTLSGCTAAVIAPGETFTCTGSYSVTQTDLDAGEVLNLANASASSPAGPVGSPPASSRVGVDARPAITLDKSANVDVVANPNDTVSYTFVATNTGNVTLSDVTITDAKPGLSDLDCAQPAVLAPGASLTCTATYQVGQAEYDTGIVENTAQVSSTAPADDPDTTADDVTARDVSVIGTDPRGSLSLVKSASPLTVSDAGEVVTYSFDITNTGNVTLSDLTLTDELAGLSAYSCDTRVVAPAETAHCTATYQVLQANMDAGSFLNTASVVGTMPDGTRTQPSVDTETVSAVWTPGLELIKSADHQGVATLGEVVRYTFIGRNTGNVTASVVNIDDPMTRRPNPLSPLQCSPALPAMLAPGATVICTAEYTFSQADVDAGSIPNTATITGTAPDGQEIPPAQASELVTVAVDNTLTFSKVANPTRVNAAGDQIHYVFRAANDGNQTLRNVTISDPLVPAEDMVCTPAAGSTLLPGQAMICEAWYTTTQAQVDAGEVVNNATVTADAPGGVVVETPATATVVVPPAPGVEFTKTAVTDSVSRAGTPAWFRYTITNTGNTTLFNPVVTDAMVGQLVCQADQPTDPNQVTPGLPTSIAPGETVVCWGAYVVTQDDMDAGGVLRSPAYLSITDASGTVLSGTDEAGVPVLRNPDLAFTKQVSPQQFDAPGVVLGYTFTLANTGNTTLNFVALRDDLPGLGSLDCEGAPTPTATLLPGEETVCVASYTTTQADVDAGRVANTATVTADPANGPGTEDPSDLISVTGDAVANAQVRPRIGLVKTTDTAQITSVGQQVRYEFVITNLGNVTLREVRLSDELPGLGEIECDDTGDLGVGEIRNCHADYTVTQADLDAGTLVNTATVEARVPSGDNPTADTDTVVVPITGYAEAVFAKRATLTDRNGDGLANPGERLTYTLTVTNTGNLTLTGVQLFDSMPGSSGLSCPVALPARLAPGASLECTVEYTVSGADAARSQVTNNATFTSDQIDRLNVSVTSAATPAEPPRHRPGWLPQTGASQQQLTMIGVALIGLVTALGIVVARRRSNEDEEQR